jgi:hypothetical protein
VPENSYFMKSHFLHYLVREVDKIKVRGKDLFGEL